VGIFPFTRSERSGALPDCTYVGALIEGGTELSERFSFDFLQLPFDRGIASLIYDVIIRVECMSPFPEYLSPVFD